MIIKKCRQCSIEQPIENFYNQSSGKFGVTSKCKSCTGKNQKLWRKDNKEYNQKFHLNWRKERKLKAIKYLGGKCEHYGLIDITDVYDFHHVDPSQKDDIMASIMERKWEVIEIELNKCILLCSNCHRREHAKIRLDKRNA